MPADLIRLGKKDDYGLQVIINGSRYNRTQLDRSLSGYFYEKVLDVSDKKMLCLNLDIDLELHYIGSFPEGFIDYYAAMKRNKT